MLVDSEENSDLVLKLWMSYAYAVCGDSYWSLSKMPECPVALPPRSAGGVNAGQMSGLDPRVDLNADGVENYPLFD